MTPFRAGRRPCTVMHEIDTLVQEIDTLVHETTHRPPTNLPILNCVFLRFFTDANLQPLENLKVFFYFELRILPTYLLKVIL